MAKITLKNLAHSYLPNPSSEDDFALKEMTHDWRDGEAYALLGSSGCGKSTLLNIISGLLRPSHGRVLFDGRDVTDQATAERNIAQVFQFPVVYDTMTVRENLAFPLKNRGIAAAEIAEEQRLLDEAQDKLKALEEKQRKGKESLEEIKKLIEYCKEVEIDVNKAVEAEARVKRLELEVNEAEEKVFEQDQKIDDLKRQETTWTEKIARQKEQGELKRQAAEASLKAAREELAAVKARNTANDAKKAEEVNQARQLELKMQKEDEEHNREVQSLVMNFASLRDQVAKYHAQIADEMGVSENERVPLQRVENFGKNGDLDNTFGWTNYDMTKNFGGIGKGKPSIAAVGRPAGAEDTEFTLS